MNEAIFGTILTLLFDIALFFVIFFLWTTSQGTIALIVSIIGGIAFLFFNFLVGKYWIQKIKEKFFLKK